MKDKEIAIMRHLRQNARLSLTKMSRKTGIPVSTIYERLKAFEGSTIKKHTCIIDFSQIGYDLRLTLLLKARASSREDLRSYLQAHHQTNTVLRINNGYDFLVEAVFKDMAQVQEFLDKIDGIGVRSRQEYYVLEELIREGFLTSEADQKILAQL